jgi:hypothetical protein
MLKSRSVCRRAGETPARITVADRSRALWTKLRTVVAAVESTKGTPEKSRI